MKKMFIMLTMALLLSLPTAVPAQSGSGFQSGEPLVNKSTGGYTGGGATAATVAAALKMPDDAWVSLTGKIDRQIGDEKYLFSDGTGTIVVEIDDEDWRGLSVDPNDVVVIQGEVDRELTRREIDVQHIKKVGP